MALRLLSRDLSKLQGLVLRNSNPLKPPSLAARCNNQRLLSNFSKHQTLCSSIVCNGKFFNELTTRRNISVSSVRLSAHGDHSKLWTAEKALSAALLGIIPLALTFPNILFDDLLVLSVVLHTHWGYEAIAIDYIRPVIFGNVIPKIAVALVYLLSALTFGGLLYFNHSNLGVSRAIRRFWTASRSKKEPEVEEQPPSE